jgi:glucokinase
MMADWWLGVDVGGTRTKLGVVTAEGSVLDARADDTDRQPFERIWELVLEYASEARATHGPGLRGVGVAAPGIVDPVVGVRNLPGKVPGIEGFPLRERLESELGVAARCVNDGAAATLAEWRFGAARGHPDVVGITIGTGVGVGVVIGDRMLLSRHLAAGISLGHATIQTGGRTCLCGSVGCAETLVSANAVVGRMREAVARKVPSVLTQRHEDDPAALTFQVLIEALDQGDRLATEILADFVRDLGSLVITAIHAYDPEIVVLSGGPLAAADRFLPAVQAHVDRYAFRYPQDRIVPLVRAQHPDHAGVLGAVALVMQAGAP